MSNLGRLMVERLQRQDMVERLQRQDAETANRAAAADLDLDRYAERPARINQRRP